MFVPLTRPSMESDNTEVITGSKKGTTQASIAEARGAWKGKQGGRREEKQERGREEGSGKQGREARNEEGEKGRKDRKKQERKEEGEKRNTR